MFYFGKFFKIKKLIINFKKNVFKFFFKVFVNYELALIESVVLLSRFSPNKCMKLIDLWYEQFKIRTHDQNLSSNLPESIKLEIETFRSL